MAGQERSLPIKINASRDLHAVIFSANGEHLLSGEDQNAQVWRVQDGQQVATIEVVEVVCLAVSMNGKWIVGGTWDGDVFVWDGAETYETVWKHEEDHGTSAVDFSSDSTTLVSGFSNWTAKIWDVVSGKKLRTLRHDRSVIAAKFSSDGSRIATATYKGSVRVWDSIDGHLLVDIPVTVTSR